MDHPDWDRFAIHPPGHFGAPAGDPTRWGQTIVTDLSQAILPAIVFTTQFVQVACRDLYTRGWSITGVLTLANDAWDQATTYPDNLTGVIAGIEITSSSRQVTLTQQIILSVGGDATRGLCNQQAVINGGPYGERSTRMPDFPFVPARERPFAAISSLVGNNFGIRAFYDLGLNAPETVSEAVLTLQVTPIAAGMNI